MEIIVNGSRREISAGSTVTDLLQDLAVEPATVVVECDKVIIDPGKFATTPLAAGNQLEIIRFVGGG
ncbi:MAG: sulfur carrier protein ThiS [Thermodesulfobacteriota bacterium]